MPGKCPHCGAPMKTPVANAAPNRAALAVAKKAMAEKAVEKAKAAAQQRAKGKKV